VLRACQAVLSVAKVMISMPFQPPLKHVFDSVFRMLVSASLKAFNVSMPVLFLSCCPRFCTRVGATTGLMKSQKVCLLINVR